MRKGEQWKKVRKRPSGGGDIYIQSETVRSLETLLAGSLEYQTRASGEIVLLMFRRVP